MSARFVDFSAASLSRIRILVERGIDAVGRDFIMRHYEAYGGPKPPPIDHQGVEDVFIEKASVVWYFYQGQWLKLTGAD